MDKYVKLAKTAVENYITGEQKIEILENLPDELYSRQAGVFVTIHRGNELRGCIGTFLPTKKNIAEEIVSNAIAACSRDNRFDSITKEELPCLSYEVSILSEPEIIMNLKNHDPKKYGIIARCADGRCGLLLPNLSGVDTIEQQILISCQKGDINPESDNFDLYEFTVEKHV